jgi:hypothetical protein
MRLNKEQLDILSRYFADLSKILFASTVVSFFLPQGEAEITLAAFLTGAIIAASLIILSMLLLKTRKTI